MWAFYQTCVARPSQREPCAGTEPARLQEPRSSSSGTEESGGQAGVRRITNGHVRWQRHPAALVSALSEKRKPLGLGSTYRHGRHKSEVPTPDSSFPRPPLPPTSVYPVFREAGETHRPRAARLTSAPSTGPQLGASEPEPVFSLPCRSRDFLSRRGHQLAHEHLPLWALLHPLRASWKQSLVLRAPWSSEKGACAAGTWKRTSPLHPQRDRLHVFPPMAVSEGDRAQAATREGPLSCGGGPPGGNRGPGRERGTHRGVPAFLGPAGAPVAGHPARPAPAPSVFLTWWELFSSHASEPALANASVFPSAPVFSLLEIYGKSRLFRGMLGEFFLNGRIFSQKVYDIYM